MRVLLILTTLLRLIIPTGIEPQTSSAYFNYNTTSIDFPNTISFETSVSSASKIVSAEIHYGVKQDTCGTVEAIAYPELDDGTQPVISWEWDMRQSGSLPPGAEIWWQWQVTDENGATTAGERQTVTWLDSIHPWYTQEQGLIRIHAYQQSANQVAELLTTATQALDTLSAQTGIAPKDPVDLYIYANTEDMRDAILYEPGWTGGLAYSEYNIVLIGISADQFEWGKRTEAHELTHVLVGDYTFSCLGSLPTWLNEGLAVFGEGGPEDYSKEQFYQAVTDDTLLSFKVLSGGFSEDPDKADLSYSQSYFMVNYLIEKYGQGKINHLLNDLSAGKDLDASLQAAYGFDLAGFEKEWRTSIHARAVSGSAETSASATPTMIATIPLFSLELEGGNSSTQVEKSTPTLEPSVTATPVAGAATPAATEAAAATGLGLNSTQQTILWSMIGCTCLIGLFAIGLLIFMLVNRKKNKNQVLPMAAIFLITGSWFAISTRTVSGQSEDPTPMPMFPTATEYAPTQEIAQTSVFSNPEAGIRLPYPYMFIFTEEDSSSGVYATITIGNNEGFGALFASAYDSSKTLQENGKSIREDDFASVENVIISEERQIELDNGQKAWYTLADGTINFSDGPSPVRIGLITVKGNGGAISMHIYTLPDNYDYYKAQITQLFQSLEIQPVSYYGYNRDEVMLLEGGESDNPRENDPATSHSSADTLVFSGLVTHNTELNLAPDLAASWEISADGTVYTFHLQPEAVFHNGKPFTSADVVYSWERAANPETESDTVLTYLGDIVGVEEMHAGKAEHISGLKVIDEHTLQVTIDSAKPYFLQKLTFCTTYIVDRDNIAIGEDWYLTPNGTGPYRLTRWEARKLKIYERFEEFYGAKPQIPAIITTLYSGDSTRLYESGAVDVAGVATYNVERFSDPAEPLSAELQSTVNLCTGYITLDMTQPPFDDLKVRQAFAMAIDRQKYIDVVLSGAGLPAKGLYPPALPGYNADLKGWEYNPEEAARLLSESKYAGDQMPKIVFSVSGYGSSVSSGISAFIQMWQQNLGVEIEVQNIEPEHYMDIIAGDRHGQLISQGWCADYPDPENFAAVLFESDAEMNEGGYSNPELDAILKEASTEPDATKRIALYQQAEQIIVEDVPAVFTVHSISYILVKPYIEGYVNSPISIPIERYISINPEKMQ